MKKTPGGIWPLVLAASAFDDYKKDLPKKPAHNLQKGRTKKEKRQRRKARQQKKPARKRKK